MKCPHCGEYIGNDSVVCKHCSRNINSFDVQLKVVLLIVASAVALAVSIGTLLIMYG